MPNLLPANEGQPDIATPPPAGSLPGAAQHRLIEGVIDPKFKDLRDKVEGNHDTLLRGLAAGFVFLVAALAGGFLLLDEKIDGINKDLGNRIESVNNTLGTKIDSVNDNLGNKIEGVNQDTVNRSDSANLALTKIQTQLDDLLQRIPPAVTSVPTK